MHFIMRHIHSLLISIIDTALSTVKHVYNIREQ